MYCKIPFKTYICIINWLQGLYAELFEKILKNIAMKIIKLLIFLVILSLQAGATGYSHNMFVAHKKLQAGKECRMSHDQVTSKKSGSSKEQAKTSQSRQNQPEVSITRQFANKLSGMVTLNQRVLEEGPASFFQTEDENEDSIVTKLVGAVKGVVYVFIGSGSFGKS
jgi:hypothetical protein